MPYKSPTGILQKEFTVYHTHRGPIVREADGKWISVRLMQEPLKALTQSVLAHQGEELHSSSASRWTCTRTRRTTPSMPMPTARSLTSIPTSFPGAIPDSTGPNPVDGSDPATEWNGVLSIDETPGVLNPRSGWLYNTNNWPWSAAGPNSPKKADFPVYVERGTENARGIHAIRVLENKKDFTIDSLIAAAYDSYLPAFEQTLPALLKAWDRAPASNPLKAKLV